MDVAKIMNEDWGYRTRPRGKRKNGTKLGGEKLSRTAAYRIFTNIFYTGRMKIRGRIVPGSHEPLISLFDFQEIQSRICRGTMKKHSYVYNRTIKCGHCGHMIVGELQRGHTGRGTYVYYRCGYPNCCGKRTCVREDRLNELVKERLREVTWPENVRDLLLSEAKVFFEKELGDFEAITEQEQRALNLATQRRSKLLDTKLDGDIDPDAFRVKNAELNAEINRLTVSISTTKEKTDKAWTTVNRIADFTIYGYQTFANGTDEQRRQILANLATEYTYKNGVVTIATNPLLPENLAPLQPSEFGSEIEKTGRFSPAFSNGWAGGTVLRRFLPAFRLALQGMAIPDIEYVR